MEKQIRQAKDEDEKAEMEWFESQVPKDDDHDRGGEKGKKT